MTSGFQHLAGVAAPLPLANVDTDKIIPGRFLTTISREGLGKHLFYALRYDEAGEERPDFILNRAPWRRAAFLVTLENFGCGSSREHAVWALADFSIGCIVAPSFADIFAGNCVKNGVLTITLDPDLCARLMTLAAVPETASWSVALDRQQLVLSDGKAVSFDIAQAQKQRLLSGRDEIDDTLLHAEAIEAHDRAAIWWRPRVDDTIGF